MLLLCDLPLDATCTGEPYLRTIVKDQPSDVIGDLRRCCQPDIEEQLLRRCVSVRNRLGPPICPVWSVLDWRMVKTIPQG